MPIYEYVSKSEYQPVKNKLIKLINLVQDELRDKFTFSFHFIGSSSRNMVTRYKGTNVGYDFDCNLYPNDKDEEYNADELKHLFMGAFNRICRRFGYDYCEDSTRVFTIKVKDRYHSQILYSCDFAIVYDCEDGRQQYIRFNKSQNSYYWEFQPDGFGLDDKIDEIKRLGRWDQLRNEYLYLKNSNDNPDRRSRSMFAEAVNNIYNQL